MKNFLLFMLALVFLLSCSDSTSPKSLTLSGQVSILDSDGNPASESLEEITVMIYNTIKIDPDLLKVKSDYPFIGAEITQEVFFDIRDAEPIRTVNCNSQGEYTFTVNKGDYNIVFYKEGYGYNIKHEVEVNNDLTLGEVVLNQVVSLSGSLSNFTFESWKVYHITDDLIIPANSNVVFETGANIDVANNKKIFLMSDLNVTEIAKEDYVKFNSIYNNLGNKNVFRGIECVNYTSYNIKNLMIKNATTALSFNSINAEINISDCSILNNSIGISTLQADSLHLSNCNILNNSNIGVDLSINNTCFNNIVFNNNEGIRNVEADCDISNSYFLDNHMGIRVGFYNPMRIHHNEFNKNTFGISMSGADPLIEHNNFLEDEVNIEICRRYVQQYYEYSNPIIKNNNIISNNYQISIFGNNDLFYPNWNIWGVNKDYECGLNYWGQEKKIKDNDILNDYNGYYVIISAEINNFVTNSGIRNK